MVSLKRFGAVASVLGLAAIGSLAMPHEANAWWRGGIGFGVWVPPVVVVPPVYAAPPVVYAPPAYYAPGYAPAYAPGYYAPQRVWIQPHWEGGYWRRGYWR